MDAANDFALNVSRVRSVSKKGLALLALIGLLAFTPVPAEREVASDFSFWSVESVHGVSSSLTAQPTSFAAAEVHEREQRALAEFIARRWRIAETAASSFVAIAYRAGKQHAIDPVLILAIMAIESGYNPVAESVMGAKGLMQVIARFHMEKLADHGGEPALLNPEVNIHVGAQILREYYRRFGDLQAALQMYGGAFDEPTSRYANKVFAERDRLEPIKLRARKQTSRSA